MSPPLLNAYLQALHALPWTVWLAGVLISLLWLALRIRLDGWTHARVLRYVTLTVAILIGVFWAWQLKWVGDDAYISFRYARNLVEGQGLVFNPGERVEGYTNFLWLLLIAGTLALGVHPTQASVILGLICFAAALLALERLSRRYATSSAASLPALAVPVAAGGYVVASYGTSGLETMFAASLVLWAVERAEARRYFLAGLLSVAAALAHPDHLVFYGALGLALLLGGKPYRFGPLLRYALPFGFIFLPWFLWRWHYYGDLYPNTFYAKSAGDSNFKQGLIYLVVCVTAMGLWTVLPPALTGAWRLRGTLLVRFCALSLPIYILYVAKIGGDFMLGRLLILPALLMLLLAGLNFELLAARRAWWRAGLTLALLLGAALPLQLIAPYQKPWQIADERSFYQLQSFAPARVDSLYSSEAGVLKQHLLDRGLRPKLATDCVGIVGYETRLPLFDLFGLTSRSVAHAPVSRRGRPGHEKYGAAGQVIEAGVELSKIPVYPAAYASVTQVQLGDFRYYLTAYKPALAKALREQGVLRDARSELLKLAEHLPAQTPAARACDLWFAREYYFKHQADPELLDRWLRQFGGDFPGTEARNLVLEGRTPAQLGYRRVGGEGFDDIPADTWREGQAFDDALVMRAAPDQAAVWGASGRFLNSFVAHSGDAATGRMVLPPFTIEADLMTLAIGGGQRGGAVNLWVDGRIVRSASGCDTEVLRQEVWNLREFRGRKSTLEIVDSSSAPWGHLVVDEVNLWLAESGNSAAGALGNP